MAASLPPLASADYVQVTLDGVELLPVAVKPTVAVAPGASVPSYEALVTVKVPPDRVYVPFHRLLIVLPLGNGKPSCQLFKVPEPVFLTTTCAW